MEEDKTVFFNVEFYAIDDGYGLELKGSKLFNAIMSGVDDEKHMKRLAKACDSFAQELTPIFTDLKAEMIAKMIEKMKSV